MKKISALIAQGYGDEKFDQDLALTLNAIYAESTSKVIDMKYSTTYCQDEPEIIHYSALVIYEYEEGENE